MKIDVPLKRPEFKRDEMGRFERRGGDLIKRRGVIKRNTEGQFEKGTHGGPRAGAGRPPGSKNKTTLALREAILAALDKVGGVEYLARLAIENSSAYASLLGKVLPSTLATDPEDSKGLKVTFERIIVRPEERQSVAHASDPSGGSDPKLIEHLPMTNGDPISRPTPALSEIEQPASHVLPKGGKWGTSIPMISIS